MVDLKTINGIYLYGDGVSFRYGINSLSTIILNEFKVKDTYNKLFVFFNNKKNQIKIIEIEENGIWLYQKKLDSARFIFPQCDNGKIQIDKKQLKVILENLKIVSKRLKKL